MKMDGNYKIHNIFQIFLITLLFFSLTSLNYEDIKNILEKKMHLVNPNKKKSY